MSKINRRQFIITITASLASFSLEGCRGNKIVTVPTATLKANSATATAAVTATPAEIGPVVKAIVEFLKTELNYLQLNEADLVAFGRDFQQDQGEEKLQDQYKKEPKKIENRAVTQFLMSTDFFWNKADESKPVKYLAYYDPYRRICSNPFARFD